MSRHSVTPGSPSRAVAYIRVSTRDQNLGPEAQRKAIETWAVTNRVEVIAWFEEKVSGAAPLAHRPRLLAAIEALGREGAGLLVTARRDRLVRSRELAPVIDGMIRGAGARFATASDGVADDSADGEFVTGLHDLLGHRERRLIAERTRAALAVKRAKEQRIGSIPYGFRADPGDPKALVPNMDEQRIIDRIEAMHESGVSMNAIAVALQVDGVPCRGSRWHATTVMRVLRSTQPRYQEVAGFLIRSERK